MKKTLKAGESPTITPIRTAGIEIGITPSLKAQKKRNRAEVRRERKKRDIPSPVVCSKNYTSMSSVVLRLCRKKPRSNESHHPDLQPHRTRYNKHTNTLSHQSYPVKQKYEKIIIVSKVVGEPDFMDLSL